MTGVLPGHFFASAVGCSAEGDPGRSISLLGDFDEDFEGVSCRSGDAAGLERLFHR